MRLNHLALAFAALTLASAAPARAQDDERGAPFVDRFERIDDDRWRVADGWSNGAWTANDWRASQVRMAGEGVQLVLARQQRRAKRFTSGELQTHDEYRYGYFETRMRAPRGSGMVSGFFTYTRDDDDESWDEIDIEILGRNTRQIQLTYFRNGERLAVTLPLGFDAADGMHSYAFEWSARYIRWYVDGRMIHEARGEDLALPQRAQRLYLHLWNSQTLTDWLGPLDRAQGPWTMHVDCVAQAQRYQGQMLCAE